MHGWRWSGVVALLVVLAACRDTPSAPSGADGVPVPAPTERARSRRRTTDGAIAVGNLEAQIAGSERLAGTRPPSPAERAAYIDLLLTRGQYLARVADYERAAALAEELVRDTPGDGRSLLVRAGTHLTFHRFAAALADLDAAASARVSPAAIDAVRAGVLQATGRYDEALDLRHRLAAEHADVLALGAEASVLADRGDLAAAAKTFAAAEAAYRDVSPFPIAWLRFLEGSMWLREDDRARARTLLQEAVDRLPAYAPAAGRLAQLDAAEGRRGAAVARLRPIAERSDDPDYAAQLARILGDAGQPEEAARWRRRAEARFDALMAVHPDAFADHAADFWLNVGGDAVRATALARQNVAVRATPRAWELLLQAASAAGDVALACEAADGASRVPHRWPRLEASMQQAYRSCGR